MTAHATHATHALVPLHPNVLPRFTVTGERVAAVVTAIAFVLLLPAASLLMSVLAA